MWRLSQNNFGCRPWNGYDINVLDDRIQLQLLSPWLGKKFIRKKLMQFYRKIFIFWTFKVRLHGRFCTDSLETFTQRGFRSDVSDGQKKSGLFQRFDGKKTKYHFWLFLAFSRLHLIGFSNNRCQSLRLAWIFDGLKFRRNRTTGRWRKRSFSVLENFSINFFLV